MSTITKISSSSEETDSYASEERKIELRRRMQLQARGKASLSLSSLEELADQHHAGTYLKNMRFRRSACLPDLDESIAEKKTLNDQALDFIDGGVLLKVSRLSDAKEENSSYFDGAKKPNSVFGDMEDEKKIYGKKFSALNASKTQESLLTAAQAAGKVLVQRSGEELKTRQAEETSSNLSYGLTKNFEDMLQKVQELAADAELWENNRAKSILNIFSNDSGLKFAEDDMAKAVGKIRFLNAFIGALPMEHPYRDELLASLTKFYKVDNSLEEFRELDIHFEKGNSEERKEIEFANDEALRNKSVESTKKNLDSIYSYLEAIAATSAAPTLPIMTERFSKVLKSSPDHAIQRLAISGVGMDTVELVTKEAARRLNTLSEKIEAVAKKSEKATAFKNIIVDEKEKLRSALLNFEKISNFRAAQQVAEKEQEKVHTENTLLGLIAKSS